MRDVPIIATYRLQLTPQFGFDALSRVVPYLARLGISHVYVSPCLEAVSGSAHGYDVTDPGRVREDFGGEEACARAWASCREHGLGVLLDIVPNHMAASTENPWWRDLLAWGAESAYAHYFDVDFGRHEGRVLLPILGASLSAAISRGGLKLSLGAQGFELLAAERRLPIAVRSLPALLRDLFPADGAPGRAVSALAAACSGQAPRSSLMALEQELSEVIGQDELRLVARRLSEIEGSPARLQEILAAQHYELRFWRSGLDEINYRRFFDVSDLAALRVEDREVFDAVHVRLEAWLAGGMISGVRVDHPDGLKDPEQYFERLRALVGQRWVLAEKVLGRGERLPETWQVDGTTGYDFLDVAGRLFVDAAAEAELTATYCRLAELPGYDFRRSLRAAKGRALRELFGAEVAALTARALAACQSERGRPVSAGDVQRALVALITALPVYRTYLRPGLPATAADREWLEKARARAVVEQPELGAVTGRLVDLLLGTANVPRHDEFAIAFQQLSGPAMAKGLEDTVFYDDARLLALNEVGCDPALFGASPQDFHAFCRELAGRWPLSLSATSTHDTKRSEDVRLRIALLSEKPRRWALACEAWMRRARASRRGSEVDPRTLYFLFQTLIGVWPISKERLLSYLLKAVREAKAWTSWLEPDVTREAAFFDLVSALLADTELTREIAAFVAEMDAPFRRHALGLTLLKLTAPGVPDIYQGTELWDFSLADPDNRRAVDYARRRLLLSGLVPDEAPSAGGGADKLWLIQRALETRRLHPECFDARGDYTPLAVSGAGASHVVAFARGERCVSVVPVRTASLPGGWERGRVELPHGAYCNVLDGRRLSSGALGELFERFPVALLVRE